MITLIEVAENIREARLYRNYSQDYLGARLGISQNAYSKIELARTNVSLKRLSMIADVLEVDIIDFIEIPNRFTSMIFSPKSA